TLFKLNRTTRPRPRLLRSRSQAMSKELMATTIMIKRRMPRMRQDKRLVKRATWMMRTMEKVRKKQKLRKTRESRPAGRKRVKMKAKQRRVWQKGVRSKNLETLWKSSTGSIKKYWRPVKRMSRKQGNLTRIWYAAFSLTWDCFLTIVGPR